MTAGSAAASQDVSPESLLYENVQSVAAPAAGAAEVERERPAAVDGSQYAVVAPLYIGQGGFYSYLRLFNGSTTASAGFTVKVVGSPSGRDYGTAIYSVPARAGRQLSVSNVLTDAGATVESPDTGFTFYLQTTQRSAGYQHVTHSPTENYFENSTVCRTLLQQAISREANRIFVWGAHTSDPIVAGYPSTLELHNGANVPLTYRVSLIEETSGAIVGQTNYQTLANTSYSIPIGDLERAVNWRPASGQIRANIMIEKVDGSALQVLAGQTIVNNALRVTLNMTTACDAPLSATTFYALSVTRTGTGSGTVTLNPSGQVSDSGTNFPAGTNVTLTAAPAAGSTFTGWSGACTGTALTCDVAMTGNRAVTATFGGGNYHGLTVTNLGNGTGAVSAAPLGTIPSSGIGTEYPAGTVVTLTAAAASGSTFAGWSGACAGTALTCQVTMTESRAVTATFNSGTYYTLTLLTAGTGSGTATATISEYGSSYPAGTLVTLFATPAAGSTFAGWSGACTGTATTCTVTMSTNRTATATFTLIPVTYTLHVYGTGTGSGGYYDNPSSSVSCGTGCYSYAAGSVVTLTPAPNTGSAFVSWSGACSGTAGTCQVLMTGNKEVTIRFDLISSGGGGGGGSGGGGSGGGSTGVSAISLGNCTQFGTAVPFTLTPNLGGVSVTCRWVGNRGSTSTKTFISLPGGNACSDVAMSFSWPDETVTLTATVTGTTVSATKMCTLG